MASRINRPSPGVEVAVQQLANLPFACEPGYCSFVCWPENGELVLWDEAFAGKQLERMMRGNCAPVASTHSMNPCAEIALRLDQQSLRPDPPFLMSEEDWDDIRKWTK